MGDTIKIDINKLTSALSKLDALATSIDTQRRSAMSNSPIALPSLEDGALGATSRFLTDQKPELQTRLDLAKLLDQDGDGQASYSVENGDQLWEVKRALSTEMTKELKDLDVNSKEDRERAALLAQMLNRYKDDPDIPWQVMNALGPKGVTTVMNKLKNLVGQYGETYWQNTGNPGEEHQALIALQESMGNGLSLMFSSASTYMDGKWGKEIAQDPWAATVMLRYIDKANRDIDPKVFEAMGVELKDREHNDPMIWSQMFGPYDNNFGDQSWKNISPLREYLNVADNSTRDAQAAMGNEDLLRYFTSERQDYDHLSDQAGKVLETATVDAATSDNYQYAMKAADISSHLLYQLGDSKTEPLDGVQEATGKIIGTYIMDAEGSMGIPGDDKPGINLDYINGKYPPPWTEKDGFPKYGINLNSKILANVLNDIGANEDAARTVGQATTMYNQALFDKAAQMPGEQIVTQSERAANFTGFMQDGLLDGKILSGEADVEERKKAADLFTLPLDFIPTDKVPVIGDYIIGEVKDGISEAYAGDNSDTIAEANDTWNNTMTTTKLQAYYSMANSEHYKDTPVVKDWPDGADGEPKRPDQLSRDEINNIVGQVKGLEQGSDGKGHDVAWAINSGINQSFDNLVNHAGK
jgi:hypothetical protein